MQSKISKFSDTELQLQFQQYEFKKQSLLGVENRDLEGQHVIMFWCLIQGPMYHSLSHETFGLPALQCLI